MPEFLEADLQRMRREVKSRREGGILLATDYEGCTTEALESEIATRELILEWARGQLELQLEQGSVLDKLGYRRPTVEEKPCPKP